MLVYQYFRLTQHVQIYTDLAELDPVWITCEARDDECGMVEAVIPNILPKRPEDGDATTQSTGTLLMIPPDIVLGWYPYDCALVYLGASEQDLRIVWLTPDGLCLRGCHCALDAHVEGLYDPPGECAQCLYCPLGDYVGCLYC